MALLNSRDSLQLAWNSLEGSSVEEGWATINIVSETACQVMAGRHFPENTESVLFGFRKSNRSVISKLPKGRGFAVEMIDEDLNYREYTWIALSRNPGANLDLFSSMAEDAIGLIQTFLPNDQGVALNALLDRIKAWQEFMERGQFQVLGPEAELGLIGEIFLIKEFIGSGIAPVEVIEAWQGPLEGIHDFVLGRGGIEVKTSLNAECFIAAISSLEQLDDSLASPLFLAAVKLVLNDSGQTLSELIADLDSLLAGSLKAKETFSNKVLRAGVYPGHYGYYKRRFVLDGIKLLPVTEALPKLTRLNVPNEVIKVLYRLDLSRHLSTSITLNDALRQLGA